MSYQKYRYSSDTGLTHPIRLSSAVAAAQPTAPTAGGPYDSLISAKVGRTNREIGLKPRQILLTRTAGAAPNVKTYYDRMPVCTAADLATLKAAGTVTINGVVWTVSGAAGESEK